MLEEHKKEYLSSLSLLVVHQFARKIIVLHQTNIMRLVRTIAWEYKMIIDYDHHWYCDIAENQLLENVERSQLEMLSSHVAQRVRAFHHLRPIVIDPSSYKYYFHYYYHIIISTTSDQLQTPLPLFPLFGFFTIWISSLCFLIIQTSNFIAFSFMHYFYLERMYKKTNFVNFFSPTIGDTSRCLHKLEHDQLSTKRHHSLQNGKNVANTRF